MFGLAVDASQPKPQLTPLMFVSIPSLISFVFEVSFWNFKSTDLGLLHDTSPGEPCTQLSCRHEVDSLTTTELVMEPLHGLAVSLLAAYYEIVNIEQQLAFRCLIGREQWGMVVKSKLRV